MSCLEAKDTQSSALNKWTKFQNQTLLHQIPLPLYNYGLVTCIGPNYGRKIWHRSLNTEFPDYLVLKVITISCGQIFIKSFILTM